MQKTKQLFESRKVPSSFRAFAIKALMKLEILNAVSNVQELRAPPSNHLEKLQGDRSEQYSIRINKQWRICFEWHEGDAYSG